MILDIPLNNCGLAGLGVTVHGRVSNSRKHLGDMGIYIKSIVPGGAAAQVSHTHSTVEGQRSLVYTLHVPLL